MERILNLWIDETCGTGYSVPFHVCSLPWLLKEFWIHWWKVKIVPDGIACINLIELIFIVNGNLFVNTIQRKKLIEKYKTENMIAVNKVSLQKV